MTEPVTAFAHGRPRARDWSLGAAIRVTPVAGTLAVAWALAWAEHGSIVASDWIPYAIVAVLLVATVLAAGAAASPTRAGWISLAALLGLAAWAGVSALWSPVPALARDESLLVAFYAAAFALPQLVLRSEAERRAAVAAVAAALGLLAVAVAVVEATTADAKSVEALGRLGYPIDYVNGLASLFVVGIWPTLAVAARRSLPPAVRAISYALSAALVCGFLGTQSKGAALGLGLSAVVVFAAASARLRILVPALGLVAIGAYAYRPLTGPFRADDASFAGAVHHAGWTTLALVGVAAVAGLAYAATDQRVRVPQNLQRIAGIAALALLLAGVGAGAALFVHRHPHPLAYAQSRWESLKHQPAHASGSSHFVDFGSNRYDFWRVALRNGFEPHPLRGVGARGFGPLYLIHRESPEFPRRAHSLEIEVLAEQGLVGLVLLVASLGTAIFLAARRRIDAIGAAVLGGAVCWLAQASVDWTWTIPAVGIPFFVLLGIGASRDGRPALGRTPSVVGAAACVAVAVFALAPPWLADRFEQRGDYGAARFLDPLSTDSYVDEAFRSSPPALAPLRKAVRMQPRRAELHYALGEAELANGHRAAARAELREALRLDPTDPVVRRALRAAR